MNDAPLQDRLRFLARIIRKEIMHLSRTDHRLFAAPLKAGDVRELENDEELAERIDAFVGGFGRLQGTPDDKMLPQLLTLLGERPASMIDNLDRAERLGWIASADEWLALRKRRNQMVHEYIEDPEVLSDALNAGHAAIPSLAGAAECMLAALDRYFSRNAVSLLQVISMKRVDSMGSERFVLFPTQESSQADWSTVNGRKPIAIDLLQ